MSGFFDDSEVRNKAADQPWMKSETDRMLDLYFSGAHPDRVAQELGRNPKAVKRRLEQFTYNERGWAERYDPFRRISRKGKKLTQNETVLLKAHQERGVNIKDTARLMARTASELNAEPSLEVAKSKCSVAAVASTLDLIWAHRWLFFLRKTPIISDEAYDALVAEEIEYGGGSKAFERIKNWKGFGPGYIRDLALYLHGKWEAEKEGK